MNSSLILIVYIFFLFLIYYITRFSNTNNLKKIDIFNYNNMFLLFISIEIPYLLTVYIKPETIPRKVLLVIGENFENTYNLHILNNMVYILIVIITMNLVNPTPKILLKFTKNDKIDKYFLLHFITLILSLIAFNYFLSSVGGLLYLLNNMDSRTSVIAGTGYIQGLFSLLAYLSVGFLIFSYKNKQISFKNKLYLILIIILIFGLLASTGGRKNSIILILYVAVLWHFNIKNIKIFTITNISVGLLLILFISAMPLLRTSGASEFYMSNPSIFLQDAVNNSGLFFKRFSDIDRSLFIYDYFNISNLWLGASFKDILTAPIPRSLFPDKPPVDEGVYIYNLLYGNIIEPGTSLQKLLKVGLPTSTITNMYINFYYPGIIVGSIMMGYLIKYFYNLLIISNYSPQSTFLYTNVIFGNLAITNLRIVGFLTIIFFLIIITYSLKFVIKDYKI